MLFVFVLPQHFTIAHFRAGITILWNRDIFAWGYPTVRISFWSMPGLEGWKTDKKASRYPLTIYHILSHTQQQLAGAYPTKHRAIWLAIICHQYVHTCKESSCYFTQYAYSQIQKDLASFLAFMAGLSSRRVEVQKFICSWINCFVNNSSGLFARTCLMVFQSGALTFICT